MLCSWLLLGALTGASAEPTSTALAIGADIQAWRTLGDSPSQEQLQSFLETHHNSPLAELAVKRLEDQGVGLEVQGIRKILDSLIAHEARLTQSPISVIAAPLQIKPLDPDESPSLRRRAEASSEVASADVASSED